MCEEIKNYGGVIEKNDAPTVCAKLVQLAVIIGSRDNMPSCEPAAVITTFRKYFYPRTRWELKDVVTQGLPQHLRFLVLRDIEQIETAQAGLFILFCSKY